MDSFESYALDYDAFMNNQDRYRAMVNFHVESMQGRRRVIDAGAGTGNLTLALLQAGHEVLAFEPDSHSLEVMASKFSSNALEVVNADNIDSKGGSSYDGACSSIVLPFPTDIPTYLSTVANALRSGALFSISAWAPVDDILHGSLWLPIAELRSKGVSEEVIQRVISLGDGNEQIVLKKNITLPRLESLLEEAGFGEFDVVETHPLEHYVYWLTCKKV